MAIGKDMIFEGAFEKASKVQLFASQIENLLNVNIIAESPDPEEVGKIDLGINYGNCISWMEQDSEHRMLLAEFLRRTADEIDDGLLVQ